MPWFRRATTLLAVTLLLPAFLSTLSGCGDITLDAPGRSEAASRGTPAVDSNADTIRIATFNIQVFGRSKLSKPKVMQILADVVRQFDVVAIQEIRSKDQNVLPRFVEMINADGPRYDYAIGPRLGRTSSKEQYAYVFNTATIEIDRQWIYTVADPSDLLHREPLVAAFRARGGNPDEAFTFTLINIHTDPDETDLELDALDDVFVSVRADGSGEDDIILLGDLNVDEYRLGELGQLPNITYVISGVPTNTRGNRTYDNILFDRRATVEYTGRAGVLDLMARYDLTLDEALEVSDHLPVWAEFSIYEGGRPELAAQETQAAR